MLLLQMFRDTISNLHLFNTFDHYEHKVELRPHGNSKGKEPFCRTKPSTIKLLKESVQTKAPRKALREVENLVGGVVTAHSASDLPRDRKQVDNLKYATQQSTTSTSSNWSSKNDVLAHVMQMCKDTFGADAEFIRAVEAAPEPMCVLATNQQLADLERFCTGDRSSVLSIDPTFNLGPFSVTPMTYQNLLTKTTRNGNHPILLGPILIHQTKTLRPFHYFASTLICLNLKFTGLKAYGTDGEPELIKAFKICFPNAVHLRCTNHLRQNIKDKLREFNISQHISKEILGDIFGLRHATHFESGLADAESKLSFTQSLERVKETWNNLERSCSPNEIVPRFHKWFCEYKSDDFKNCVLPEARRLAGCGDPTCFFTTNSSESLNHIIKQEVEWKETKLPILIEKLKSIIDDQICQNEKAVISQGEWRFAQEYSNLVISKERWFSQMSENAKRLHLKKVFSQKPIASLQPHGSCTQPINSLQPVVFEDASSQPNNLQQPEVLYHSTNDRLQPLLTCSQQPVKAPYNGDGNQSSSNFQQPTVPCNSFTDDSQQATTNDSVLSVSAEECQIRNISLSTLQGIWSKAEKLIKSDGHIIKVPWLQDDQARLVRSYSSPQPHLVTRNPRKKHM